MIWKILIVVLVADFVKRIIQYGPYELKQLKSWWTKEQ